MTQERRGILRHPVNPWKGVLEANRALFKRGRVSGFNHNCRQSAFLQVEVVDVLLEKEFNPH